MSGARVILVNSAWMMGAEVAARVASLVTILYLSRTLAPHGVGIVEFGLAVFAFLYLVTINGMEARLVPAAVHRPADVARLAGRSLVLGWSQLGVALAVFLTVARWLVVPEDMWTAALVFGSAAAVAPFTLRFAFMAGERMWPIGIGLVAGSLAFLGLVVGVVHAPDHALRVGACWALAMVVRAAIPLSVFVGGNGRPRVDFRGLGPDLVRTAALGLGGVARGLMASVDVIVLGILAGPEAVATYALGAKVPLFLGSLVGMFHTALFPSIVRAFATGATARVERITPTVVEVSLGLALTSVVCLGAVAGPIVTLLFTPRFVDAGPIMAGLLWRLPLSAVSGLFRTLVWAQSPPQDARVAVQVLLATTAVLVGATVWLGTAGAVVGMLCGDAISVVLYARHVGLERFEQLRPPARVPIAAALAGVALLAIPVDVGSVRIVAALCVWAVAVTVAVWPRLGELRRLLDDET